MYEIENVYIQYFKPSYNAIKPKAILTVREMKLKYFGHLISDNGKQKVLLEGKIEGTKRRGRQRNRWGRDILKWTNKSYEECVRLA